MSRRNAFIIHEGGAACLGSSGHTLTSTFGGVIGFLPGDTKASGITSDLVAAWEYVKFSAINSVTRYAAHADVQRSGQRAALARANGVTSFTVPLHASNQAVS